MRLLLTAVAPADGRSLDLAVDCEDDARVADIAEGLGARLGITGPVPVTHVRGHLGVVGSTALADAPGRAAPALWIGDSLLDPAVPVADSLLRHGAVVGVGGHLPDVLREPYGVVELRVSSGPGAGQVQRLGIGSHAVGRDPGCALVLADPRLPPVAVRIDVSPDGTVVLRPDAASGGTVLAAPARSQPLEGPIVVARRDVQAPPATRRRRRRKRKGDAALSTVASPHVSVDPDQPRALVDLDRLPLEQDEVWTPGLALTLGDVVLDLAAVTPADASLSLSPGGGTHDFNRPPRLMPEPRTTEFALPKLPTRPEKQGFPFLMLLAPVLMGAAMFAITKRPYTLLFIAMSPMMILANFSQGRRGMKRRFINATKEFEEKTAAIEQAAFEALVAERTARRRDVPDPAEVLLIATGPRARLWERRRTDPDWLVARIGTADVVSEVVLRDPQRETHQGPLSWTAPDVPVTVRLEEVGVTGIAGAGDVPRATARWVIAQIAALHSAAELEITVLSDADSGEQWQWVRWLPHVRADADTGVLSRVGTDEESTQRRVGELGRELDSRRAAASGQQAVSFTPLLVVLDGARRLRLLNGMVTLLREGPRLGITFLCLDTDARLLPEECKAVVTAQDGGLRLERSGARTQEAVRPDLVGLAWCERVARALAPIRDVSQLDAASAVPGSSRLLTVLRLDPPTGQRLAAGWARCGRSTRAVIGEGADGPFELDIRRDGPHGLIAGTTGSGKSELLQTLIASLAVGNRPDEMTFVLVDYKGGAAFKDCNKLPHTVGMVTDLDGHLTTRALVSLGAELRRREHQLAGADAKDIEDYLAGRTVGDPPMPRLMIVIDEFAALVSELPDFVTGLVDIARRGRSLGVHLILATQRPAGVVSAEIKSNTNLRIALRVTDSGDSQDVIESKEASQISKATPGRGYARLGFSSLVPFQSSRVGGRPRDAGAHAAVGLRDVAWDSLGAPSRVPPGAGDEEGDITVLSDLSTLVQALQEATVLAGVTPPPSPWLPPLPELVTVHELEFEPGPADLPPIPLGLADLPAQQRQEPMTWDLAGGGHLAIAGQPRSGRSTVLRLIAGGIAAHTSPRDVHVYALDFGNNALLPLLPMPHVGAVVTRDQQDRLRRLLTLLGSEVTRRQQLLAEQGYADIAEQRQAQVDPDARLPYLVVLLDRWEGFVAGYEQIDGGAFLERMSQLLREGAGVGLRMVLSGDRSLLTGRMATLVEDRLLLRMPSAEDYALIGMRSKDVPTQLPAGRAFRAGEVPREVQLALLDADPAGTAQVGALQRLAAEAAEVLARTGELPAALRPRRVDDLPVALGYTEALALADRPLLPTELLVGVGGDTLALRTLDVLADGPGLLVIGAPRSGRSSVLLTAVTDAVSRGWNAVVVTPRRSPLRDLTRSRRITQLDETATPDDLRSALRAARAPRLLVIDDYEVLGADHPLAAVADDYLKEIRDKPDALLIACGIDEVTTYYRGPTAAMRKSRTGLVLAPRSSADGEAFSARLPRSVGGAVPLGRGIFVRVSGWEWVQVPKPAPPR